MQLSTRYNEHFALLSSTYMRTFDRKKSDYFMNKHKNKNGKSGSNKIKKEEYLFTSK